MTRVAASNILSWPQGFCEWIANLPMLSIGAEYIVNYPLRAVHSAAVGLLSLRHATMRSRISTDKWGGMVSQSEAATVKLGLSRRQLSHERLLRNVTGCYALYPNWGRFDPPMPCAEKFELHVHMQSTVRRILCQRRPTMDRSGPTNTQIFSLLDIHEAEVVIGKIIDYNLETWMRIFSSSVRLLLYVYLRIHLLQYTGYDDDGSPSVDWVIRDRDGNGW